MSELKNILGADISSNVNDLVLGAETTENTIADLSVGVCKDDECLPVEIIDPCTANTSCGIDTEICTNDSTCTGDYNVCDAPPPNPCVNFVIGYMKSCYLKINPIGMINDAENLDFHYYDIIPILSSSTSDYNTIKVVCDDLNISGISMTLSNDYAYLEVNVSAEDEIYSNINTGYTSMQTIINIPGHNVYMANISWYVVEYLIDLGNDMNISDIETTTINVNTKLYEIMFRDNSIITDLAPFKLSFNHNDNDELSLHYYVYKSGNTIDRELLEYNLITPYDDFNVTIENGIDNIVTKTLNLYEKEYATIYLDDLISASTSINGNKVLTLNYLKEMIPNLDTDNVSKITESNVCLNPSLSKYTYVPFGCNTYPEDEKQLMLLNNVKAFSSRSDAAIMGIDTYQQMNIFYAPVYKYVTQRKSPNKNIINYSASTEVSSDTSLGYNITVDKDVIYNKFQAYYNIPDENGCKRIRWIGTESSININLTNNGTSVKKITCKKTENENTTVKKTFVIAESTRKVSFNSKDSSNILITNEEALGYKLKFNIKFGENVYLGFDKGIKTAVNDACFVGDITGYSNTTPDVYYTSFGDITNVGGYSSLDLLNTYGFQIGSKNLKIGDLYTNSWFKKNGLSTYNNYIEENNIFLLPFYQIYGGQATSFKNLDTNLIKASLYNIEIPLYINTNSKTNQGVYPNWKYALVYYNGQSNHSGYNNLHFSIKYDILTDNITVDSKYTCAGTEISYSSSNVSYDSTDDTYIIEKTITIDNPVFRMKYEEWNN